MTTFIAIYRGSTVGEAKLIALSADPIIVADVARRIVADPAETPRDPVLERLDRGRRTALRLVAREAGQAGRP